MNSSAWAMRVLVAAVVAAAWAMDLHGSAPADAFDIEDWHFYLSEKGADAAKVWSFRDGVIECTGEPHGYMRTKTPHKNYRLTFEWRWTDGKGGNSGVLLHIQDGDRVWPTCIEAQLLTTHAGDMFVVEGAEFKEHTDPDDRRVPRRKPHNERPMGEWNAYEITCREDTIRLAINGLEQNVATGCTVREGYIGFQSEGAPVAFRNIRIEPLNP